MQAVSLTYDFDRMKSADFAAQAKIAFQLNGFVTEENLDAQLIIEDLADRSHDQRHSSQFEIEGKTTATIALPSLPPHRVYRIWVSLTQMGNDAAIGYVRMPHYHISWSERPDHERRRQSVFGALQHYYLAKMGRAGNMDCWAFTRHYLAPIFPSWNRRTHYGPSIPGLAAQTSIIGDYVRIPDYHSLIVLAHDAASGVIWSVEGNFNSTIEVVSRTQFSNWWLTHHHDSD
jgi:hypothetical protein